MSPTFVEEIVKEEGFQLRIFLVSRGDVSQEDALELKMENELKMTVAYRAPTLMMHPPRHIFAIPE